MSWHGASSGCGWREVLRIRRATANILNKQSRTADKGWSSSLGVGRRTKPLTIKNFYCYEMFGVSLTAKFDQNPFSSSDDEGHDLVLRERDI
jgi:hypothetical protein